MKTLLTNGGTTRDGIGVTRIAPAIPVSRAYDAPAGARPSTMSAYFRPAAGALLGKHAQKRTWMAGINATGWPLGPQDWSSG